ncbi:hypothetical protein BH09PSE2_BH09PSE2_16430 [soil metagenome]
MRLSTVLLIPAALGLVSMAACNLQGAQTSALAPTTTASSHVLLFSDDGSNAKLALAESPATLMLECAHGTGRVHVTHASTGAPQAVLTLASGSTRDDLRADRQAFEGQTLVLGESQSNAPALSAFRRSGRLQVSYAGQGLAADAQPEAFFAACERRS